MAQANEQNKSGRWTRISSVTVNAGLLLVVVGILLPMFGIPQSTYRWLYAAGALMSLLGRFGTQYTGPVLRLRRLTRIEMWASVFFCVAAFFMFYPGAGGSDWLAFTIAGGAILIYTSIMIPRESAKKRPF
ncbi:MAG: hypothetical protein NC127_00530 [Muribaculum sp.]|nr:hypothetical protein [Muribaculum sp.]